MDFPWEFGGHFDRSESLPAQGPPRDSLPLSQEEHRSQPKPRPVGWAGGMDAACTQRGWTVSVTSVPEAAKPALSISAGLGGVCTSN